jgi:sugar phosphate isomerase/epimerase
VLHLGETDITREYFRDLVSVVEKEGAGSEAAVRIREDIRRRRDAIKGPYLEAGLRSLEDLLPHAEAARIVLGIENRYYFHQVPLPEEIPAIVAGMDSPFVRYWHDIGHAHVMESLGFTSPAEDTASLPGTAYGVHIHDAVFIRDHKVPGAGEIPLASILERIPESAIKIVELSDRVPRADVVRALAFLKELGLTV